MRISAKFTMLIYEQLHNTVVLDHTGSFGPKANCNRLI